MIKSIILPDSFPKMLAIIMPVYNEEENLENVIEEWAQVAIECSGCLVFLNDGSKDSSLQILQRDRVKYKNHIIIIDKFNSGHAHSCLLGYKWASQHGFEWVFQTDSDGQTKAKEFLDVWPNRVNYDFIFGNRFHRLDGFHRVVISKILQLSVFIIFKVIIKDVNVPFRLMKIDSLTPILPLVPENIYLGNAFLTILIHKKFPIKNIKWFDISFVPRMGGKESVSMAKFFKIGPKVIKEFWKQRNLVN